MKIAVVGGGSTYTPELIDGIARLRDKLVVEEVALVDPDEHRLDLVGGVCRRILAAQGHPARLITTTDLDVGVEGADAVLLQLRVGGQEARLVDETLPLEYCCVGQETTGAGGLAKALRTVPVVLDIARRVAELAPGAWIVNFTNPVGIVTRALLDAGHRAVGLCNVAIGMQRLLAGLLGVEPDLVALDHVGLNHLTWVRAVRQTDDSQHHDLLPALLAAHAETLADECGLPVATVRAFGSVPSYYLRYYFAHDAVVRELRNGVPRAAEVKEIERKLLDLYADPDLDHKPALLAERGGAYYSEAAVAVLSALVGEHPQRLVVNVRNRGTLPFLEDDAVIEVPAQVSATGAQPMQVDPLDPIQRGLVAHASAYEQLALDAAVHGGRARVARALLGHPLIGQVEVAEQLTDALLQANKQYLPWARA